MDESDYFLREFVKARNQNQLKKVKLKKVVSDILLAQKVKRFLVSVQADSQQTTGKPGIVNTRRRLSVRLVSPRGIKTPKLNVSRRNTINKTSLPVPEIHFPPSSITDKTQRAPPRSGSKTRVPNILPSAAKERTTRPNPAAGTTLYPSLLDRRNGNVSRQDVSQKTSSAKMPRIENKSANGRVSRSVQTLSPSKKKTPPLISVGGTSASTTSLPALPDTLWVGDPKAIGSVRRPRKDARELLAAYKSGEDSRRLHRQMTVPCTRNCHKPDLFSEMERMYTEVPSLLPAIEKARKDLALVNEEYSAHLRSIDEQRSRDLRSSLSVYTLHSHSSSRRNSIAASHMSGRQNSVQLKQTTVRHHGSTLRQITAGVGFRY